MNNGKIAKKYGTSQFVIKSQKGQQLNEREVYEINNGVVEGLLRFSVERRNTYFRIYYDLTGYITLRGFLRHPLNKQTFSIILRSILDNINALQQAYFNYQYVLMDINRVLVNPSTNKVYFIYVPIQSYDTQTSLRELLLGIVQNATFSNMEDNSYVKEYIRILNSGLNFSVFELEEYIKTISNTENPMSLQPKVVCSRCNNIIPTGINYCMECGAKISSNIKNKSSATYDPANISSPSNEAHYDKPESVFEKPADNFYQNLNQPNVPVYDSASSQQLMAGTYLVRKKNGEKIPINKMRFILGKDRQNCDYFIIGNTAISRAHAEIVMYNNHYFIVDKNSTNKTFVNNNEIPPEANVEIYSGTRIRLADEDFVFFTS